jgi:hypothetical protein
MTPKLALFVLALMMYLLIAAQFNLGDNPLYL